MKKILVVLSEWGYWGEELIGPLHHYDEAGYDVTFCTPKGGKPPALPPSMDPDYFDPPLAKGVTSPEMAQRTREIHESDRLANPVNLSEWFPEHPYYADESYLRKLEAYNNAREKASEEAVSTYDSICLVGGSGPIVDMVNNRRLHDLVLAFYRAGKPIAAECYGVTVLAFARDTEHREPIIRGKHVTGHPLEYDYKDGTGFVGTDFNMGPPPYPLEYILRDAVGPEGKFHGNVGKEISCIVDYPFITGRSTADSMTTGEKHVEVLEKGLTRYGW